MINHFELIILRIEMIVCIICMAVALFFIAYAMVGYPILLGVFDRCIKPAKIKKNEEYEPTVSCMIVAHNEEKVILNKLLNVVELDYPADKLQIIITSDYSTDNTNAIVKDFISSHPEYNILLYETEEHKGKTNAQNEGRRKATGEILVMTDANAMFKKDAIKELVSSFTDDNIAYVCGKLVYTNGEDNLTGNSETTYWNLELKVRDIESRLQTITAGNGSIYAVRTKEYIDVPLIESHDSAMPYEYSRMKKRAVFNPDAISFEKTGENNNDEFSRKVRMNRGILNVYKKTIMSCNIFKYKWFSFFYFGHRTCRYSLWVMHLMFLVSSVIFTFVGNLFVGLFLIICQLVFYLLGLISINRQLRFKLFRLAGYYSMTVLAQALGALRQITGKSKPVWEKADSTR